MPKWLTWLVVALIVLWIADKICLGATYYGGVASTGDGSGSDRSNLKGIQTFRDTTAAPGDVVLLQPGAYDTIGAGTFIFDAEGTTNVGTLGHNIMYQADPVTVTPMPADWRTRLTPLPAADPAHECVFGVVEFKFYRSGGSYDSALPYYITLNGLRIKSYVYFYCTNAGIAIVNCAVDPGNDPYRSTTVDACLHFRHCTGSGSDMHDIFVANSYLRGANRSLNIQGIVRAGGLFFSGVRGTECSGSAICDSPNNWERYDDVIIQDSIFDHYVRLPEDTTTTATRAIVDVDPANKRRHFQVDSDVPSTYTDFVDFTHGGTPKLGLQELGDARFDHKTLWVTLAADAPWDLVAGSDIPKFYDDCHGSGWHIEGDHCKVRRCLFYNIGDTAGFYIYKSDPGDPGPHDIECTDNLCYSAGNTTWGWCFGGAYDGLGANAVIKGNTFIGLYDAADSGRAYCHYGRAVQFKFAAGADASANISNNLIVGLVQGHLGSATRCGNIVYSHGTIPYGTGYAEFASAGGATNQGNQVLYDAAGYPGWGAEPTPFNKAAGWFVSSSANFNDVYTTFPFNYNFQADFHAVAGSPLIAAGDTVNKTLTDLEGATRLSPPTVGALEYLGGGGPPVTTGTYILGRR